MNGLYKIAALGCFLVTSAGLLHHYLFVDASQEYSSDREYYFELYDIEVVRHPTIESSYPEWFSPDTTESITNLNHRLEVLPFQEDKQRNGYIVYPKHGMVVPLSTPSKEDADKIHTGVMFDHYPYLDTGALHYRGNNPSEGFGNMVVAAHSSYLKDAPGRYKTVFQVLPISKVGEKIFVYLKNDSGSYDLYTYIITDSFRTSITDISVLSQTREEKFLTTYGCYIIGDNSERWVNHAILESITKHSQKEIEPTKEISKIIAQEHGSPTHEMESPLIQKKEVVIEKDHLVDITSGIPSTLLPKVNELVIAIIDRISENPELYTRVHTRLLDKIAPYESIEIEDENTLKIISIYRYIYYYLQLIGDQ